MNKAIIVINTHFTESGNLELLITPKGYCIS